jgi:hypothetical protein
LFVVLLKEDFKMTRKFGLSLLAIAAVAMVLATADSAQAFGRRGGSCGSWGGSSGCWGGSSGSWGSNGGSFGGRHWRHHGSYGSNGGYNNCANNDCGCNGEASEGDHHDADRDEHGGRHEARYHGERNYDPNQPMPAPELSDTDRELRDRRDKSREARNRPDTDQKREHADRDSKDRSKSDQDRAHASGKSKTSSSDDRPLDKDKAKRDDAAGAEAQKQP